MTNFRTLDLNLLRVFDMLMSEGSLTRAAEALAITQPAASHALKRLHDALGETLFVRSAFGMKPTPRAEALWPQVRDALGSLQRALAPDRFDPRHDSANFRVAMTDGMATLLSPALVREIETLGAPLNLRTLPLTTRDPRRLLHDGGADLAIGHFPDAVAAIVADGPQARERHQRLHETSYVCVMRREHPLARKPLTLDDYCAAHHLIASVSGRPHGYVDEALAALGRRRRVVLTVNQFFTAGQVLAQSDLLTVMPLAFLAATGSAERLVTRPIPVDLAPVALEMLWPVRLDADPAQRWLRDAVRRASGIDDA